MLASRAEVSERSSERVLALALSCEHTICPAEGVLQCSLVVAFRDSALWGKLQSSGQRVQLFQCEEQPETMARFFLLCIHISMNYRCSRESSSHNSLKGTVVGLNTLLISLPGLSDFIP